MRKLGLLAVLFAPLALAESVSVEPHSLLRLPASSSVLQLQRLDVADYGTLLIPANLTDLSVEQLRLGHEARIAVVPGEQELGRRRRVRPPRPLPRHPCQHPGQAQRLPVARVSGGHQGA